MMAPLLWRSATAILPAVNDELHRWQHVAERIPDRFLRTQALASLRNKRFHAEGGALFALLSPHLERSLVQLIVALQTISDYLDNLCDRSECQDLQAYRQLHQAMLDAVDPAQTMADYYRYYPFQADGQPGEPGYLSQLVRTSQDAVAQLPSVSLVLPRIRQLLTLYNDLQVYKHGPKSGRERRLQLWYEVHRKRWPALHWWEFAAASGSTLAVFALLASASHHRLTSPLAEHIFRAYFPWINGWHILLDYLIDQEEDFKEGDLNLVAYYPDARVRHERLHLFFERALVNAASLRQSSFHRWIVSGLPALYLSDVKVQSLGLQQLARSLLRRGGLGSSALYVFCLIHRHGLSRLPAGKRRRPTPNTTPQPMKEEHRGAYNVSSNMITTPPTRWRRHAASRRARSREEID